MVPFMKRMMLAPVAWLRQRMSTLPSLSKSLVPAIRQLVSGTPGRRAPPAGVVPCMNETTLFPVTKLRHRMSDMASPLKSALLFTSISTAAGSESAPWSSSTRSTAVKAPVVI